MSKIYEALLRAEEDRGVGDSDQSVPEPSGSLGARQHLMPASENVASGEEADLDAARRSSPDPRLSASVALPSNFNVAVDALSSGPNSWPTTAEIWKPDFSRLPALTSRGAQVEQFRGLRSKLFEFRSLNQLKTILVCSALPAEGKTFVAANLAVTLARHRSARVLLIDGDLRRSSQQTLLGTSNELGLAEYLASKATAGQIIHSGMSESKTDTLPLGLASLRFIPSGTAGDKAADLSANARFAELLSTLGPSFDWIIVDSSPVNLVADGVNLARACDGVLFIARSGVTRLEVAQRALTELKACKILGVVLNAVEDVRSGNGYYGYDSYDPLTA